MQTCNVDHVGNCAGSVQQNAMLKLKLIMLTTCEQNLHNDWMMFDFNRMWLRIAHIKIDADDYTDRIDWADATALENHGKSEYTFMASFLCAAAAVATAHIFWFEHFWLSDFIHSSSFI